MKIRSALIALCLITVIPAIPGHIHTASGVSSFGNGVPAGTPFRAGMASAQTVQATLNATSAGIVSTAATFGTTIVFGLISGLKPFTSIPANSTSIEDSSGAAIGCTNAAYNVSSEGTVGNLTVICQGNASVGPFSLAGTDGTAEFRVQDAGIASTPDGSGGSIFIYPETQAVSGSVSIFGADFLAGQNLGYPVVGNQSYPQTSGGVADSNGAFMAVISLLSTPSGAYEVRMSGAIGLYAMLNITPDFVLSRQSGHVGEYIAADLYGFAAGGRINVSWENVQAVTAIASDTGEAVIVMSVPPLPLGLHTIYANSTGLSARADFLLNSSTILLSKYSATPRSTVIADALGFPAESTVRMDFNGIEMPLSVKSASNGTATFKFMLPPMTAGSYQIQAFTQSGVSSNVTLLKVLPTIKATVSDVHVGSVIGVSGNFYFPSSNIKMYIGNLLIPATFRSNASGGFYGSITVPVVPGGSVALGAYDSEGNRAASFIITVLPSLNMTIQSAEQGSRIVVTGSGFLAWENVTLLWNGLPVSSVSSVSPDGTFRSMFIIPPGPPGSYLISAENSTAVPIVFEVTQYTGFVQLLPAILLPLLTGTAASLYLFARFRIGKGRR